MSENALTTSQTVVDLANRYGVEVNAFLQTVNQIAMPSGASSAELMSCLIVAREHGLNPLTKEIYFMKTRGNQVQPIVSVDGWMRKCNEHPQFDGVEFEDVKEDGKLVAMTCKMYRKDRSHPISITEDLEECTKGGGAVWKTHPTRMLRNRSYCQAARMAFGFAGIMEPDEFHQWQANEGQEPIALQVASIDQRDGGDFIRKGKRPSANAYLQTNGNDKFNALLASIGEIDDASELQACFDSFERDGLAWADFPVGWAELLHDGYCHRLADLNSSTTPRQDPSIAIHDLIGREIEHAGSAEDLAQIFRDNFDAVPWGTANEEFREDLQAAYDARISEYTVEAAE